MTLALAEGIAEPAERSRFLMRVAEAQTPEWEVQLQIAFPLPASRIATGW